MCQQQSVVVTIYAAKNAQLVKKKENRWEPKNQQNSSKEAQLHHSDSQYK